MSSISERYRALIDAGHIEFDPAQAALIERLDTLCDRLVGHRAEAKPSALSRLFGAKPAEPPRGLYVHGPVGRGKTMLMDLFFAAVEVPKKRRVHFHAFMADVHARLHEWRQARKLGRVTGEDPIAPVAADLARESSLLCFDEFAVRDIADAMILGRLFTALFSAGVVVVATSNVAPDDLYKDGLNRALFLPFIALLKERCEVAELDARTDYRLEKLVSAPVYSRRSATKRTPRSTPHSSASRGRRAARRSRSSCWVARSTFRRRPTASPASPSTASAASRSARPTSWKSPSASTPW